MQAPDVKNFRQALTGQPPALLSPDLNERMGRLAIDPVEKPAINKIRVVDNVHQDDIHCIIMLANQTLITGSKDGSLKQWDLSGKWIRNVFLPDRINYKNWVTALCALNESQWISGTRNGEVEFWSNKGEFLENLKIEQAAFTKSKDPACKERNIHRVNCLSSFQNYVGKPWFFSGWPTQFTQHAMDKKEAANSTRTSENDWVYAVEPVSCNSLLVVTGSVLELYTAKNDFKSWSKRFSLIQETRTEKQRPFISAITPLFQQRALYGLAVFDGSVKIYDIAAQQVVFQGQEHKNRVWTVENLTAHTFASCGDDGFVKIWDMRVSQKSLHTLKDNEEEKARVSILKLVRDSELLSGSCPDDVRNAKNKARFSFWDLRRI